MITRPDVRGRAGRDPIIGPESTGSAKARRTRLLRVSNRIRRHDYSVLLWSQKYKLDGRFFLKMSYIKLCNNKKVISDAGNQNIQSKIKLNHMFCWQMATLGKDLILPSFLYFLRNAIDWRSDVRRKVINMRQRGHWSSVESELRERECDNMLHRLIPLCFGI